MNKLTDEHYWDERHTVNKRDAERGLGDRRGLRRVVDRLRTNLGAEIGSSYTDFLYEQSLRRHLPKRNDWKVLEIGCAPGQRLTRIADVFGYQPYGVEYSPVGVEATRATFARHGVPQDQVIPADMFSPEFQQKYAGQFDVVFSRGLIEHFDKPKDVVAIHAALVKPGGYLFCSIPNLFGLAGPFFKYGARDVYDAHNLSIMKLPVFRSLFEGHGLNEAFCGMVGQLSLLGVASVERPGFTGRVLRLSCRVENFINHFMFLIQRGRAIETRWSPLFLYIGKKPG